MGRTAGPTWEPTLELRLFGRFALQSCEGSERIPLPHKAEQLLAYLAVEPAGEHSRDAVAEGLWTDAHGDVRKQFRQALWILRTALRPHARAQDLIRVDGGWIELQRSPLLAVDFWELQHLVEPQHRAPSERALAVNEICSRPLLEGWSNSWAIKARDWARARHLEALDEIVRSYRASSNYDRVLHYTAQALLIDPALEVFHRERIRAYGELGDRAGAALAYRLCVEALRSGYGLEPGAETVELVQRALGIPREPT